MARKFSFGPIDFRSGIGSGHTEGILQFSALLSGVRYEKSSAKEIKHAVPQLNQL